MFNLRHLLMDSFLLLNLTICLMFSGGHCFSESMSCSTVNGKTICEKQTSNGNTAGAFSGAFFGQSGVYQDAAAMSGSTATRQSHSSRTVIDNNNFRGFGVPNFHPNRYGGQIPGVGHLIGTGASDATSFRSDTGRTSISTSGFSGTSNNNGIPGPAFGGFAVADSSGNNFYNGGNTYNGNYAHGHGIPNAFDAANKVFTSVGMGSGFPFNMFGRKR